MRHFAAAVVLFAAAAACGSNGDSATTPRATDVTYGGGDAPVSIAADRGLISVPEGRFVSGSTPEERATAYDTYRRTAGHDGARKGNWFANEAERHKEAMDAFRIDQTQVTGAAYAEFLADTGTAPPLIDEHAWEKQGFVQDYATQVQRFNWSSTTPPEGREDHPVVLVTWEEANRYCDWRGKVVGEPRRLPTALEYEKAARGANGLVYPWGNSWDASKLNSAVEGPEDTVSVGSFPDGQSPYGMLDAAGNVFQWTSTPWPRGEDQMTVKGSAWDDYGGVGRGASNHGRRRWVRHAIVGFRCAADG